KIPRQDNMYSFDMKNIVPKDSLTCLVDSKLPTTFWAEAFSTACYVQNRVLIVKPHNKTPYELFRGFKPAIGFMKPFGCHVTILNTLDNLGKFDVKSDEGFFVGYSLSSKAFRVYNNRTRKVQENLYIGFLENKPMIEGNGPKWLFDIDSLTQSMNYVQRRSYVMILWENLPSNEFRYLKGKPSLGLWYSKESPLELVAYTDSDYAGATQDSSKQGRKLSDAEVQEKASTETEPIILRSDSH
ncbi:putative ribonuclease H-like domain-containing protein, partial [Tanacetum coccineum]